MYNLYIICMTRKWLNGNCNDSVMTVENILTSVEVKIIRVI